MNIDNQTIKQGLLLLGSIAFTSDIASVLHELCHGIGAILTGGSFNGMTINPFSWCYCYCFSTNQLVLLSAGAIGAIAISVLLFVILYRWTNPYTLPLLLLGPVALIDNGAYYAVDIIARSGGDACRLIDKGISPIISVTTGILSMIAGAYLAILLIRKLNLLRFNFKKRLTILGLGIIPHTIAMLIWNGIYNRQEIGLWSIYSGISVLFVFILAAVPKRLWIKSPDDLSITFKPVMVVNGIYALLLIFWIVGPFSGNARSNPFNVNIERFTERPDYFPEVMIAPPYATDISFSCPSDLTQPHRLFSYNIPESIIPEQVQRDIEDTHKKYGYIRLTHAIDDPNEIRNNGWTEESETVHGIPFKYKQCRQHWLKTGPKPLFSYVTICYSWKKEKFNTAFVINPVSEWKEIKPLYNYAIAHPEQFDPNQINLLKNLTLEAKEVSDDPNEKRIEQPTIPAPPGE